MNTKSHGHSKYIKFFLYAVVIVLINIAGVTLFFRADLTGNKIYSLSPVSKNMVSTITEPLTVKVFFTKDLPAPYNTVEQYLRDLLNEYAINNKKYFKVNFYNVDPETEGVGENTQTNQQMARDYGINPIQIQNVEQDEIKFKQAYMGLVLIHGDIIERLPTITATDGLEYQLTTAIQKLNHRVSALLALDDKIKIKEVLSSSFSKVAPYMGIKDLEQYSDQIKTLIEQLNAKNYNRLEFETIDPTTLPDAMDKLKDLNLMMLKWPDIPQGNIKAGQGVIGMLVQYKDKTRTIPLLNVVRLPLFGDQYQLTSIEELEEHISTSLDRLININEEVGYLADHGTVELFGGGPLGPKGETAGNLNNLLNKTYTVKEIALKEEPIPDGLKCLIIAGPKEKFSDYDLYKIDQALMRGTNLAVFMDTLQEQAGNQGMMMGNQQLKMHEPLETGLEKLLEHYGVRVKHSMTMDEECFVQRKPPQQGGGEQPIYFIPKIENQNINKELDYLKNIKGLFAFTVSPMELVDKQIKEQNITTYKLFSSSNNSWEIRDHIILNPMFIRPPASKDEMHGQPLSYLMEGTFSSYFKGKPMPEKPADKDKKDESEAEEKADAQPDAKDAKPDAKIDLSQIEGQGAFREQSSPAKIFVVGSSRMVGDQLIDESGQSPNTVFALNMIDALNDRDAVAAMRSKEQRFNPLAPIGAGTKFAIKAANMSGLPIVVILFGLIVWWRRHARRKQIQLMFQR